MLKIFKTKQAVCKTLCLFLILSLSLCLISMPIVYAKKHACAETIWQSKTGEPSNSIKSSNNTQPLKDKQPKDTPEATDNSQANSNSLATNIPQSENDLQTSGNSQANNDSQQNNDSQTDGNTQQDGNIQQNDASQLSDNADVTQPDIPITAKSAVLIENHSGRILYEKEKDQELIPASITKIMTLLLIFEALESKKIKLTDDVTVSEFAASMGGSQVYLEPGETQNVDTMIKCISIASANDAAVAMAEYISGSETEFVKQMNEKAKSLGMKHTNFKNCNGLDDSIKSGHYSSAYDVALMSQELVSKHPDISKYSTVWMDEITHETKRGSSQFGLSNTNKLVRTYNGITGLKTGSTSKAKYCLSATAERNGVSLTAVIMAAPDPKERFVEASTLLDYGFANCKSFTEKASEVKLKPCEIRSGTRDTINGKLTNDFSYTLCGNETAESIRREIRYKKELYAPVKKGEAIGYVTYYKGEEKITEIPIIANETVQKSTYLHSIKKMAEHFFLFRHSIK